MLCDAHQAQPSATQHPPAPQRAYWALVATLLSRPVTVTLAPN